LVLIRFASPPEERAGRDTRADQLADETQPRLRLATEENEREREFFPWMSKNPPTCCPAASSLIRYAYNLAQIGSPDLGFLKWGGTTGRLGLMEGWFPGYGKDFGLLSRK
jgi:hypothetical protein